MRRREFIAGLGAAITGSVRTDAQDLSRLLLVGYLDDGPVEGFIFRQVEFRRGLAATVKVPTWQLKPTGEGSRTGPAT
jgi:hypothetical protein